MQLDNSSFPKPDSSIMLRAFRRRSLPPLVTPSFKQPSRAEHCPSGPEISILWPIDLCLALLRNLMLYIRMSDLDTCGTIQAAGMCDCGLVQGSNGAFGELGSISLAYACGATQRAVLIIHQRLSKLKQNKT